MSSDAIGSLGIPQGASQSLDTKQSTASKYRSRLAPVVTKLAEGEGILSPSGGRDKLRSLRSPKVVATSPPIALEKKTEHASQLHTATPFPVAKIVFKKPKGTDP